MTNKNLREEIKQKAKELANEAYWRTKPNAVSMYEISDPNVEEILQKAMEQSIEMFMARAIELYWDSDPCSTKTDFLEKLESLQKEAKGE